MDRVSDWLLVDQRLVDRFADVIGDHQFIHVDPERAAREGGFGGTIAHGFLVLSLLTQLQQSAMPPGSGMEVNYGFDKVRFVAPVRVGSRIRARFTLISSQARGTGRLDTYGVTVEVEGQQKPAAIAEWHILKAEAEDKAG
ncbi:nodulation protein NodN [Haematobacter massiliensis]|uniref:Nodulation protein NodN n=1 Tax=Haematobacter massiliensis TaxID=195105 RepID=A0A086Y2Q8_9RHOB|nr:MaoC family dehydratase [Haematobacter massiliensis]KFI28558.1 nodulation protein NodN [Haematobacter massiliensis]OWJ74037.1 nodulation protein NodN [Haematobacter massiliensis]OWJ85205.1 nodulation protein NodN [Haematobacter massiliensis]QBJ26108.1 MaoC family dehydratase [Haematobacter massiliensis]